MNEKSWNVYRSTLRWYSADQLLQYICRKSAYFINKDNKAEPPNLEYSSVFFNLSRLTIEQPIIITPVRLIDLAYYTVLFASDPYGNGISDQEFNFLYYQTDSLLQEKGKEQTKNIHGTPEAYLRIWSLVGEQIQFQTIPYKAVQNAIRELYILLELSKTRNLSYPDYSELIKQETGFDALTIERVLYTAAVYTIAGITNFKYLHLKEKQLRYFFPKVIALYTTDYHEVKGSILERQIFYTKPFVKTKAGNILPVSCFLSLYAYEHSILWIIRNHYARNGSGEFLNAFGCLFETYFEELLEAYVEKTNFERIEPTKNEERADWKLQLGDYCCLVEQKSSLLSLLAKQQECDHNKVIKFATTTIIKAMRQLHYTESALGEDKHIKIILLYEDYLIPEIMNYVFELPECDIENDHFYWIVTIDEMERLLYTYKHNRKVFDEIISEKIKRETESSKDGKRFQIILDRFRIRKNIYLEQDKFMKFEKATTRL